MTPVAPVVLQPLTRVGQTSFLHRGGMLNLARSPDGRTLRTLAHHGLEAIVTDWSAADGQRLSQARLRRRERVARSGGALAAEGRLFVAHADTTLAVYDVAALVG